MSDPNLGDNMLTDGCQAVLNAKAFTWALQGKLGLDFPGQIYPFSGRDMRDWAVEMMCEDFNLWAEAVIQVHD